MKDEHEGNEDGWKNVGKVVGYVTQAACIGHQLIEEVMILPYFEARRKRSVMEEMTRAEQEGRMLDAAGLKERYNQIKGPVKVVFSKDRSDIPTSAQLYLAEGAFVDAGCGKWAGLQAYASSDIADERLGLKN